MEYYTAVFQAYYDNDDETASLGYQIGVVRAASDADAQIVAERVTHEIFPLAQGWHSHHWGTLRLKLAVAALKGREAIRDGAPIRVLEVAREV